MSGLSAAAILMLWMVGATRTAVGFAFIVSGIDIAAFWSNFTIGEIVGRSGPLAVNSEISFPSGHGRALP